MTYLAECTGTTDCSTFNASDAQWFKIDQMGLKDAASGTWWHENFCMFPLSSPSLFALLIAVYS